jgi:hypothetical protein
MPCRPSGWPFRIVPSRRSRPRLAEQRIEVLAGSGVGEAVEATLLASSRAERMKPPQAERARAPPTLMRRTPSAAMSATVSSLADPTSRLSGLGATASTSATICSRVVTPGAYRQSAPALA